MFKVATNIASPFRICVMGAAGAGKTWSSLEIAAGAASGDYSRVAVIDYDKAATKYASAAKPFQVCEMQGNDINSLTSVLDFAAKEKTIEVVIVDHLTAIWRGEGGVLDMVSEIGPGKDKLGAWRQVTPLFERLMTRVASYPKNIILTIRCGSKLQEREVVDTKTGVLKKVMVKVADQSLFRPNSIEFTLDCCLLLSFDHKAVSLKDRSSLFDNRPPFIIDQSTGHILQKWASKGLPEQEFVSPSPNKKREEFNQLLEDAMELGLITQDQHVIAQSLRDESIPAGINKLKKAFVDAEKKHTAPAPATPEAGNLFPSKKRGAYAK